MKAPTKLTVSVPIIVLICLCLFLMMMQLRQEKIHKQDLDKKDTAHAESIAIKDSIIDMQQEDIRALINKCK